MLYFRRLYYTHNILLASSNSAKVRWVSRGLNISALRFRLASFQRREPFIGFRAPRVGSSIFSAMGHEACTP